MRGKELCCLLLSLVAGILIGNIPEINTSNAAIPISLSLILFLSRIIILKRNHFRNIKLLNDVTAYCVFIGLGIFTSTLAKPSRTIFYKDIYTFEGTISDYTPTNAGDKLLVDLSFIARAEDDNFNGKIKNVKALITLKGGNELSFGDKISGKVELSPIETPGNYYNKDYTDYLRSNHIYLTGYADSENCNIVRHSSFDFAFFKKLRYDLEAAVENTPLQNSTKNFLISVLLGDKTYLSQSERLVFSDSGVAHIFAVSGFHVSMVGTFILLFISVIFFGKKRHIKFLVCIPFIWFYVLLVGVSPATCRAAIMLSLGLTAASLQRKNDPLRSLGWACILILSFYPSALFDIGFQLSVVCVGCLILFAEKLNFINHRNHPWLYKLTGIVTIALIAAFSTWMICAFYFHRFSLMFLPLNIVAVPLLPFYLLFSLIYLGLFSIGLNISIFANIIDYVFAAFQKCALYISSISVPFDNLHPGFISVILWLLGISIAGYVVRKRKSNKFLWVSGATLLLSAFCFLSFPQRQPDGFIVQKNNKTTTIMYYENGKEQLIEMPMIGISKLSLHGKNIITVNTPDLSESTPELINNANIIILGKGITEMPEEIVENMSGNCKIVTHPSLHWRYEKKILSEARENNLNIHSVRYDGPLHVFND